MTGAKVIVTVRASLAHRSVLRMQTSNVIVWSPRGSDPSCAASNMFALSGA